jgi:hypothetical protein
MRTFRPVNERRSASNVYVERHFAALWSNHPEGRPGRLADLFTRHVIHKALTPRTGAPPSPTGGSRDDVASWKATRDGSGVAGDEGDDAMIGERSGGVVAV